MTESVRIEAGPDGVRFPDLDLLLAYPAKEYTENRVIAEAAGVVVHNEFLDLNQAAELFKRFEGKELEYTPYLVIDIAKPRVTEPERAS